MATLSTPSEPASPLAPWPAQLHELETDPHGLAALIAQRNLDLHRRLLVAFERAELMKRASASVMSDLNNFRISSATASELRAAQLPLQDILKLIQIQMQNEQRNASARLNPCNPADELRYAFQRLIRDWEAAVQETGPAIDQAQQDLQSDLDAFAPAALRMLPGPDSLLAPFAFPQNGYVGEVLALDPAYEYKERTFPRWLMEVEVLPDRSWAILPRIDLCEKNLVFLPDDHHFNYQVACRAMQRIVLDQMSRAAPGCLRLTWIDPLGHGQSAGPLLELIEIDKQLIDQKVWFEPDDIEAALRRVSDRMAELEQRCLRDTFEHLDAYNRQAGQLAEAHHVVVVAGYPYGFTESTAQRLRSITESGGRLGISVLIAMHPSMAPMVQLVENIAPSYATLTDGPGPQAPPSWWTSGLLPSGDYILGHAGRAYVSINTVETNESVWVPCRLPAPDAATSWAIVRGYGTASVQAQDVV